jgi:CheY-like chemotaxis protein
MTLAALSTALFVALGSRWRSSAAPTANAARALPRDDLVVLVAAADATKRAEVVGMLASLSVTALTVDDGAQAHALLASRRFDAALIDVRLPMLDGLEVARRRRAREAGTLGRRLPIVAMTGIGEVVDMQACAAAGVDDVLSAPFGAADLQLLLSELVGGQRALDDRRG